MFVRKNQSNKGIIEMGKFGIDRINVDRNKTTIYTAGGNIFSGELHAMLKHRCFLLRRSSYI